jgi:hypothetical protein
MKAVTPEQEEIPKWHSIIQETNHRLAKEGVIDVRLLYEIECYVAAHRADDLTRDCAGNP